MRAEVTARRPPIPIRPRPPPPRRPHRLYPLRCRRRRRHAHSTRTSRRPVRRLPNWVIGREPAAMTSGRDLKVYYSPAAGGHNCAVAIKGGICRQQQLARGFAQLHLVQWNIWPSYACRHQSAGVPHGWGVPERHEPTLRQRVRDLPAQPGAASRPSTCARSAAASRSAARSGVDDRLP